MMMHNYSEGDRKVKNVDYTVGPGPRVVGLLAATPRKQTVYYFMCRSTCSRCWHTALLLGTLQERLRASDTELVIVGDSRYFGPAKRLAAELQRSVRFLADCGGVLRRLYGVQHADSCRHEPTLVVVDKNGVVRYRRRSCSPVGTLKATELLQAVEMLGNIPASIPFACCSTD